MDEALTRLLPPGQLFTPTVNETAEFSAAARWTRTVSSAGSLETAVSIHDVRRDEGSIRDDARVLELTFQHTAPRRHRHATLPNSWNGQRRPSRMIRSSSG
jgi:hypothetical protein